MSLELNLILLEWFFIGFTGAVMPGSLLAAVVNQTGLSGWKNGGATVIGHCLIELVVVGALIFSFNTLQFFTQPYVINTISLFGGLVLSIFGIFSIRQTYQNITIGGNSKNSSIPNKIWSAILLGIATSVANPYFLIWWAAVGSAYITQILSLMSGWEFIATTYFLVYGLHIIADISWYGIVIASLIVGKGFLKFKSYRLLIQLSGLAMIILGGVLVYQALFALI